LDLAADIIGFLGSLILLYPAWRLATLMKESVDVFNRARASDSGNAELGMAIADMLKTHAETWKPWEYWTLRVGAACIVLSFGLRLIHHYSL